MVRSPTKSESCPESVPATNGLNGHGPPSVTSVSDSSDSDSESSDDSAAGGPDLVVGAHRLVLAMASPVFENTLYGEQGGGGGRPVVVRNWDPGTFKLMIE